MINQQVMNLLKRTLKHEKGRCVCRQCGVVCDTKDALQLHINQNHNQPKPPSLNTNQSSFAPSNSKRFQRPFKGYGYFNCTERFATYRQRQHHMLVRRNVLPLQCRFCNKFFNTIRGAEDHTRHVHNRSRSTVICGKCDLSFYNPKAYDRHLRIHRQIPLKCTINNRRFDRKDQFHDHLIEKHSTGRKLKDLQIGNIRRKKGINVKQEPESNDGSNYVDLTFKAEVNDVLEISS